MRQPFRFKVIHYPILWRSGKILDAVSSQNHYKLKIIIEYKGWVRIELPIGFWLHVDNPMIVPQLPLEQVGPGTDEQY